MVCPKAMRPSVPILDRARESSRIADQEDSLFTVRFAVFEELVALARFLPFCPLVLGRLQCSLLPLNRLVESAALGVGCAERGQEVGCFPRRQFAGLRGV